MTSLAIPTIPANPAPPPPTQSPLSPADFEQLQLAQQRSKKIRRAATVANLDASLSAIFAGLTVLSLIFSPSTFPLAIALCLLTLNAFRGARKLRRFDLAAPRILALNQLALAATLITYAIICLYHAATTPSALTAADPELAKYNIDQLEWMINLALYSALILGSLVFQSLAAFYYITRKKHILVYLNATPGWILQLQKTQTGG